MSLAAVPGDADEGGATLLAVWRSDRAAMRRALAAQDVSGLLALLGAILGGPGGVVPPLGAAARGVAETARDPAAVLRAVIARVVADRTIDLQSLASADARVGGRRPPVAAGGPSGQGGPAGADRQGADWAAVAEVLDGVSRSDRAEVLSAAAHEDPARLGALLAAGAEVSARAGRFLRSSDAATRQRLFGRLWNGAGERALAALEILGAAAPRSAPGPRLREVALAAALERQRPPSDVAGLVRLVVARVAGPAGERRLAEDLLAGIEGRPQGDAAREVADALRAILADAPEPEPEGIRFAQAAGLVLVAPYLPMLFRRLEIVGTTGAPGPEFERRALDVLHALAYGEPSQRRDGRGVERLLCAVPPGRRLPAPAPLPPGEARMVEDLLAAVVARWGALGQTSVAGLREAFLQREGLLRPLDSGTALKVTPRAYDMLLDRLPWSIALVKFAWMPEPLHVKWRG